MADRSWFFASQGQQQGPVPQARLRELIAAGAVTAQTLVWTEGMANWQRAGKSRACLRAPWAPRPLLRRRTPKAGAVRRYRSSFNFGPFALDPFVPIALVLVIPAPLGTRPTDDENF